MSIGIAERINDPEELQRTAIESQIANLRVAMPGMIQSFDPVKQTAVVQPAITENIKIGNEDARACTLPVLMDVPVCFPRGGGYCITLPVKTGDECLIVFADSCIDGWWQSGGVQNQMETRRHDLSDAFAILGVNCVPRAVSDYSADALQVRGDDGNTFLELKGADITMKAATVKIEGNVIVTGEATISGIAFTPHKHGGISKGGELTEPPIGG